VFDALSVYRRSGYSGYFVALTARPQVVGYGLTDSPAGLAAFFLWHPGFAQWSFGDDPNESKTKDEVLDDITLYWLTNTATSSGRLYWENRGASPTSATAVKTAEISVPVGVTVFPDDVYRPPETWARRAYPNLIYFNEVDRGGHFAAWEQPQLFAEELRGRSDAQDVQRRGRLDRPGRSGPRGAQRRRRPLRRRYPSAFSEPGGAMRSPMKRVLVAAGRSGLPVGTMHLVSTTGAPRSPSTHRPPPGTNPLAHR
jgi:hypothetical protein